MLRQRSVLPACELDGQYEQHSEQHSPAEQPWSPGHQKQHLPERRLPHPAQHYRRSAALRPIYTPRLTALYASICLPRGGEEDWFDGEEEGANLDWT